MLILTLISAALAEAPLPSGPYTLASSAAELESQRSAAVDVAVSDMNFAWAAIARGRLKEKIRWCDRYMFSVSDTDFTVQCDDSVGASAPLDGRSVPFTTASGAEAQVRFESTDAYVTLHFTTEGGSQETRYQLREDGSLVVDKVIRNEHLSAPARWTMRYRDAD